jgi:hypothetical protein
MVYAIVNMPVVSLPWCDSIQSSFDDYDEHVGERECYTKMNEDMSPKMKILKGD